MRILLACLMCLVLSAAECFALKGGPDYTRLGPKPPSTYSGAFFPIAPDEATAPDNSVALFTVTLASTGLGTGTVMIFREGNNYSGTFSATFHTESGGFVGTVDAFFIKPTTRISTEVIEPGSPPPPPQDFEGDCTVTRSSSTNDSTGITVVTTTAACNYRYTANGRTSEVRIIRGPSRTSQPATARIDGTARIDYRSDDPNAGAGDLGSVSYSIVGYRQ